MLSLVLCTFNGKGVNTLEALSAFKELRSLGAALVDIKEFHNKSYL